MFRTPHDLPYLTGSCIKKCTKSALSLSFIFLAAQVAATQNSNPTSSKSVASEHLTLKSQPQEGSNLRNDTRLPNWERPTILRCNHLIPRQHCRRFEFRGKTYWIAKFMSGTERLDFISSRQAKMLTDSEIPLVPLILISRKVFFSLS